MIEGRYAVPIVACLTLAIVVILLRVGPAKIVAQSPKKARRTVR